MYTYLLMYLLNLLNHSMVDGWMDGWIEVYVCRGSGVISLINAATPDKDGRSRVSWLFRTLCELLL